jgi:hypothetical protein
MGTIPTEPFLLLLTVNVLHDGIKYSRQGSIYGRGKYFCFGVFQDPSNLLPISFGDLP